MTQPTKLVTAQDTGSITWNFTYDPNGRLIEVLPENNPVNGAQRYQYNAEGYLVSVEVYTGSGYQPRAEMQYDGLGQRLVMTAHDEGLSVTTNYVVDPLTNSQPLTATALEQSNMYLYGYLPIGELTDTWSYSLSDGMGTPRQLTNADGEVTLAGSYTPWGDILEYTGNGNFTWGYFGGLMDASTGLLYLGNGQYYDPVTGRFLTRETHPESTNPYVPWSNDPVGLFFGPVVLITILFNRKRRKGKYDLVIVALLISLSLGLSLVACGTPPGAPPSATPPLLPSTSTDIPLATSTSTPTAMPAGKTAYLTFDDGPDPYGNTAEIAIALNMAGVKATFFVTGISSDGTRRIDLPCQTYVGGVTLSDPRFSQVDASDLQLIVVASQGHAIGLHGWQHPIDGWSTPYFDVRADLNQEVEALLNMGITPARLIRAPGGDFGPEGSLPIPGYENWHYYGWTVNSFDTNVPGASQVVENIMTELRNRNFPDKPIILLHSTRDSTWDSIVNKNTPEENIVEALRSQGYTNFESLPRRGDPVNTVIW